MPRFPGPDPSRHHIVRATFWLFLPYRLLLFAFGVLDAWFVLPAALRYVVWVLLGHATLLRLVVALIFIVLAVVGAIVPLWMAAAMRLVVSDAGIEYHEPGLTLIANWPDILGVAQYDAGFLTRTGWRSHYRDRLLLKASQVHAISPWARYNRWLGRDLVIPVDLFAWNWRRSKIWHLIAARAYHFRDYGRNDAVNRGA